MLEMIKGVAMVLRFLLELCALGASGYWGFVTGGSALAKVGLGPGVPLVAAVAWGAFVAPKALVKVPGAVRLLVEVSEFAAATATLYVAGSTRLAHGIDACLRARPGLADRIVRTTLRLKL
jgi:hypothetical protein